MGTAPARYIGLMSGTSMDGVDAALCEFASTRFTRVSAWTHRSYPSELRAQLLRLQRDEPALSLRELCHLDNGVAQAFAHAAQALLEHTGLSKKDIRAIGSHGQTVFHDPADACSSVQLGNPSLIAAMTGIDTIADFRRADIAHGGQGAPLVPAFHHALFAVAHEVRCVVNIGGIANVSIMRNESPDAVLGFDTGPGNGLLDEWIHLHRDEAFDRDGEWARSGQVRQELLDALWSDGYFAKPPPKSTGRGHFNLGWARRRHPALSKLAAQDVQATFCELTARSIVDALQRFAPGTQRVLLCGGGARNIFLRERLGELMEQTPLELSDAYGLSLDLVEATAFAWLAMRHVHGLHGNLPIATGAGRAAILGGWFKAPPA